MEKALGILALCDLLPHAECCVGRDFQDTFLYVSATPDFME